MQTKKIAQTDAIFSYVHSVNQIADQTDGVIRISIDTKATVKVGDYSRGGYSRQGVKAAVKYEKRINVLESKNIIPVELSPAFHLDIKMSVPVVDIYRWSQSMLRE